MGTASAYVLIVRPDRREPLLDGGSGWYGSPRASEPVPRFNHSRTAPLVVLASFEKGLLTHVGNARKGASAGTGLVRLNLISLDELNARIRLSRIIRLVPKRFQSPLRRVLAKGGLLPPKTLKAVVDVLSQIDPDLGGKLNRLSTSRAQLIATIGPREKENLALQKETLATALSIAGVATHEILEWSPETTERTSFLEGLPGARVREDVMISADFAALPGFAAIREAPHIAARTFESETDSRVRVTVVVANRLPLEQQTGADLIYYNETYRSFVLVQHKALESGADEPEFRWTDDDQFASELKRMDALLEELNRIEPDTDPDGFRFSSNPFFLKFCSRIVFNPDDRAMFPGMYLPHGLWKVLAASERLRGPRGGNLLTFANVGRRLNSPEFTHLVASSWVGTTITQSQSLEAVIRTVLESGRTVTFAIKRSLPPDSAPAEITVPTLDEGQTLMPIEAFVRIMN